MLVISRVRMPRVKLQLLLHTIRVACPWLQMGSRNTLVLGLPRHRPVVDDDERGSGECNQPCPDLGGSLMSSLAQVPADDEERLSGRFWLPDDPDRTVGGWLSFAGRWPALELAEPLTPALKEIARDEQPDGSVVTTYEPADDDVEPTTTTIHGLLRKGPRRRVTLIETFNSGRE